MEAPSLTTIIALEALAVTLMVVVVLVLQNRKMRELVQKLQARLQELVSDIKKLRGEPKAPPPAPAKPETYVNFVNHQIDLTKKYHFSLRGGADIALDIDPEAPLPRRTAALRHAILIAEKEANSQFADKTNWDLLGARYQQLLDFNKDYDTPASSNSDELNTLKEELEVTRKRVGNLERFKGLYFELEAKWRESTGKASQYYDEMTHLISEGRPAEDFTSILQDYHAAYTGFNDHIEGGLNLTQTDEDAHLEIARLRNVTVDQHRIINNLQDKLNKASTDEQRVAVIKDLQGELSKQSRYLQESETCIKLMEDELKNANKELETLRARAAQFGQIRSKMKDMQANLQANEQIIHSLKTDNRRLNQKLKTMTEAAPEDSGETRTLRRELSSLKTKYAELEERYLDLKIQT